MAKTEAPVTTEVATKNLSESVTKMDQFNSWEESLNYAQKLIDTKLVTFTKPEHVVLAFQMGKSMGLDPVVAATNLYVVNGKVTLSVHLLSALAKKSGYIDWELIKDGEIIRDENNKQVPPYMITTIRFHRYNEKMNKTITNEISYTWSDAINAGLVSKDNWKRMPKNMLRARCLSEGIRFIAPDLLAGVFYESSEVNDFAKNDTGYKVVSDADGNVVLETN